MFAELGDLAWRAEADSAARTSPRGRAGPRTVVIGKTCPRSSQAGALRRGRGGGFTRFRRSDPPNVSATPCARKMTATALRRAMAFSGNLAQEGRGSRTQWDTLSATWGIFEIEEESFDLSHLDESVVSVEIDGEQQSWCKRTLAACDSFA